MESDWIKGLLSSYKLKFPEVLERESLLGPSYIFGWALWLDDINGVILGCRRFWGVPHLGIYLRGK